MIFVIGIWLLIIGTLAAGISKNDSVAEALGLVMVFGGFLAMCLSISIWLWRVMP